MATLVVTEKPSVARDLARVLGADKARRGYLEGGGYLVTWAVGHLVGLPQPHEIDPTWKSWSRAHLPMLPASFPLVVLEDGKDQYAIVERLLQDRRVKELVCATDAGREGELIFRYILERSGVSRPFRRLWISSLTDAAIREGFARLEPGSRYDALADAARARSRADWLVGMNLSRHYSIGRRDLFSVGRVQTPTLAMIVERERAIRAFVPTPYLEVVATLATGRGTFEATYHVCETPPFGRDGKVRAPKAETARLPPDGTFADAIVARAREATGTLEAVDRTTKRTPAPLLYDLTELQRDANRLFGLTAKETLDAAQQLYERHKMISYPRTDSRHLSPDVAETLPPVVQGLAPRYSAALAKAGKLGTLGARHVDASKVGDHHAIVPTGVDGRLVEGSSEAKVFDLVARRLLAAHLPEKIEAVTTVVVANGDDPRDRFFAKGVALEQAGFSALELRTKQAKDEATLPPGLEAGNAVGFVEARKVEKKTQPQKPYTEATLLTAMESAGRTLDSKELAEAMRDSGLGTPATRAAVVETLLARGYLVREGKALRATPLGESLIDSVHEQVRSPAMTGEWELRLSRMARGEEAFDAFMRDIEGYVASVVAMALPSPSAPSGSAPPSRPRPASDAGASLKSPARASAPPPEADRGALATQASRIRTPVDGLEALLRERFGFQAFRPHQAEICAHVTEGASALVVMPTGAGKSLCYQLPGLARAGTTLVVSPLIALIEDQVGKLRAIGAETERIHSGMDRATSRDVSFRYLRGELDFLFIAPERLSVPGFPEMLAKRPPVLVAVDEAHCISQWGHDFRPDYRLLRERLAVLGPVPTLALTATATSRVQGDILAQLGMSDARRFVFGFRRTNLAIECVDASGHDRATLAAELLADGASRPAIVYAPTRKEAEATAETLSKARLRASTYHAGLSAPARSDVQTRFLEGRLDVIVATIAFGMGIDKADVRTVVHAALPASIEGYYQEIGRAGRDGAPSRAVLFFGEADKRTHEFFFERDYPDVAVLDSVFSLVSKGPLPMEVLASRYGGAPELVEKAVEKLFVHGGVEVDFEGVVRAKSRDYARPYERQRAHKREQLDRMTALARGTGCRMLALLRHFGDPDDLTPCGLCDHCAPSACVGSTTRSAEDAELSVLEDLLIALGERDAQSVGKLFERTAEGRIERGTFDALLAAAARERILVLGDDSFTRDGRTIIYRTVSLGPRADDAADGGIGALRLVVPGESSSPRVGRARKGARKTRGSRDEGGATRRRAAVAPEGPLVDALREFRKAEAKRRGVPPFIVFSDRDLAALAAAAPRTEDELLEVDGFGAKKVQKLGKRLLAVLRGQPRP